ncbi:hypothetical protein [Streptomyces malaysiense]|uniref:hypothetical protein n=1 Tax=Streptomyces malaysiense TaxID=1428626 RepID=UPI00142E62B6|nr:hypothetical protein [Streptomyces malaysiense]
MSAVDRRHSTGRVSHRTRRPGEGGGVASGACRSLARRAFDDAGPFRLEPGHRADDPASCRAAGAAGFAVAGLRPREPEYDGVRRGCARPRAGGAAAETARRG